MKFIQLFFCIFAFDIWSASAELDFDELARQQQASNRTGVLAELKKPGKAIPRNEATFYTAWVAYTSTKGANHERVLQDLTVFFEKYWVGDLTHVTQKMLADASDIYLAATENLKTAKKWHGRDYPTQLEPLESIRMAYDMLKNLRSVNLAAKITSVDSRLEPICVHLKKQLLGKSQECLFALVLHGLRWTDCSLRSQPLKDLMRAIILDHLAPQSFDFARELAVYYNEQYQDGDVLQRVSLYDPNPKLRTYVTTPNAARHGDGSGYCLPLMVAQLMRLPDSGRMHEPDLLSVVRQGGKVDEGTYLTNALQLLTLQIVDQSGMRQARNFFMRRMVPGSLSTKEERHEARPAFAWMAEHLPSQQEEYGTEGNAFAEFERFYNSDSAVSAVTAGKPKKHRKGRAYHGEVEMRQGQLETAELPARSGASVWKEAQRQSAQDNRSTEGYKLSYTQGSGSRVHFLLQDGNGKDVVGFTYHMEHSNVDNQIQDRYEELVRFGLALHEGQQKAPLSEPEKL